ncbi:PREDICTED: trafficking protein particle complex subunit 11 [Theobroma cacao]|uniref:Trafficking protein particle complex subunit 11 n=1 Tax=Theobroma cacao TaxID=3641 RepID=A0AB32VSI3_THECC|nr:PREDICTED: trafficking protein particle complex subunit 11 [Theobroma cacao]
MEEYPEELRSPPVRLVALVGCPEQHGLISSHLLTQQPPINTLALPDLSKLSLLLQHNPSKSSSGGGILRRDWLVKHRAKIPAVVVALFSWDQVSGDPAQWGQVCSDLDELKAAIRPRNIKLLVLVLLQSEEISEDRLLALRKRAEVDSKFLLLFNPDPSQLNNSLQRLGAALSELATTFYRDEGRRIKARIEKKTFSSLDHQVRYCFKVAVHAEFRRDWVEALRFYEDAFHALREMVATSTRLPPIQRLLEIKTVAEHLHFKISTLLLHGGKLIEAVTWFRQHIASYKNLVGSPKVIFLHWEWLSRQFLVFAELLDSSCAALQSISSLPLGTAEQPLTEWEFHPAYYYQSAAQYLKEKRSALEFAVSISETFNENDDGSAESVVPSIYVGQFARLLEQGDDLAMQFLTDDEYTHYAFAEGKRFQDSFEIIALLKKSHETYSSLKVQRMGSLCAFQIAREYFSLGDFSNAKQLFDGVANLYRQEGWVTLLWEVLGYLRECSRKQVVVKEFIEFSLEMAALPVSTAGSIQSSKCGPGGPASLEQREMIHSEILALVSGEARSVSLEGTDDLKVNGENTLHLEIDLVSPLRSVLLASVAFHEQIIKSGVSSLITLSLLSQLPLSIEIDQLEVQFNQSNCNFIIMNAQKCPLQAVSSEPHDHRMESAPSLALATNKWLRLTYDIKPEQSGKLECISVIAKMGPHFTICCRAESPASMDDLPLWKFEDRVETFPTKDPALSFSGQKAAQVEEPDPQVDVTLGSSGPALVGERFVIPVTIASRDHAIYAGEMKINLVDVRGGGLFSPRESEPFSMDSHHVELLGIVGPEGEDDPDKIKKIQQSFGLVSVPFLNIGESWSCKLEIMWHRPKPIMLFVSLGYSPNNNELNAQKVNVHKTLQIEGKNAVLIGHHFMLPFRRDSLLLSRIKPVPDSDQLASLPLHEATVLIVSAKNCSEVTLQLLSMSIEVDNDGIESCSIQHGGEDLLGSALVPGEEFKKVFTIIPQVVSSKLMLGTVYLKWKRHSGIEDRIGLTVADAQVLTTHKLPVVHIELSPLVVSLDCPPYAILGDPFMYCIKILNKTELLQEVKFSLADSQSFVLSGSHNDTVFVLPNSEHILCYKVVPLASGLQQLPRISLASVRYSARIQPSIAASTVFIFPSKPQVKIAGTTDRRLESIVAD